MILNFDLDYKGGNNSVIYKVYVGNSNPFTTYIRGSDSDHAITIGQSANLGGLSVHVDNADDNTVKVDVGSVNDQYLKQGKTRLTFVLK